MIVMTPLPVNHSVLENAPFFPPDSIYSLTQDFLADDHPNKILVGRGAYQDEDGKPWILPSVQRAEDAIRGSGHEYLPIAGLESFRQRACELFLHGTQVLSEGKIASCQSVSGTGALYTAGATLKEIGLLERDVLLTTPTWANHQHIFESLGFRTNYLPYYRSKKFDFEGYIDGLRSSRNGSIVILHACAHNPTGFDPTRSQWKEIGEVIQAKRLFPIFDGAYLGFKSGDVDDDAWAIRYFVEELRLEMGICISFAKNMGLYGERIGLTAFATTSEIATRNVNSVLERVQRASISTPPLYGAQLVSTVLGTPALKSQWDNDIITMSTRISSIRRKLYNLLVEFQTPGDWSHVVEQSGMFTFMGLSEKQVAYIRDEFHIYMLHTSRIALTGLNNGNLYHFVHAVDAAVRAIA